jgi:hypothetical protein
MSVIRSAVSATLLAAGIAVVSAPAAVSARQPKDDLPRPPSSYREVSALKTAGGIGKAKLDQAKEAFGAFAKYFAEYVSHPRVYTAPQDFRPDTPGVTPYTVDYLINELNRHLIVPSPVPVPSPLTQATGPNDADYVRELGAALDAALKEVVRAHDDRVVRVNAARLLAAACRTGATAHYPTVTELLTDPNTAPEVKYYLFQAAGNLLAAYDLNNLQSRNHSHQPKAVADLITALQDAILKPATILPAPAAADDAKLDALPPAQQQVLAFIRRQAVRALAQARFAEFKVSGGPTVYPAFTLARVAMSDPAISPPPGPAELAEAVIGICNMTPPRIPPQATEPYAYAMADAVTTGVIGFATPRAVNPGERSLPWRGTAARIGDALKTWQALFDPNYNPARPAPAASGLVPPIVARTAAEIEKRVLAPMDGTAARIDVDGLRAYRDNTIRGDMRWTLAPFRSDPTLVLPKK